MTTGLPARVAICAVLMTAQLAGPVRAQGPTPPAAPVASRLPTPQEAVNPERRQVAVIDLSGQDMARPLVGRLYEAIAATDTMIAPTKRDFDNYLAGRLDDDDAKPIDNAKTYRTSAMADLDEADSAGAEDAAKKGQLELANVTPSSEIQALYSDLSFLAGVAELDQGKAQDANLALALAHRLDPQRQLSDARYPPNTIAAYKRAVESKPQLVKIDVRLDTTAQKTVSPSDGRVWIDFVERGPVGTFEGVEVGNHVVTIVGPELVTAGVVTQIKGPQIVLVGPSKAAEGRQVWRARLGLARAEASHDDAARESAMKKLAGLLGVRDAVVISMGADGQFQWETWREATGFSAAQALTDQQPDDILKTIGPLHKPPPPFVPPVPLSKIPVEVVTPWYHETWVQASIGAGVVAVVVGSIFLATRARQLDFTTDVKDVGTASTSR